MKKTLLLFLAFVFLPAFSSQAQEDQCFIQLANGKKINLNRLCAGESIPNSSSTPTLRTLVPVQSTQQSESQQKPSRCPYGYKLTKNDTCRGNSNALISVSEFKLTSDPNNQYLHYVTYTITNLVEVPVYVTRVVIHFNSPSGSTSQSFIPAILLQPNQYVTRKELTSAIYSLGVKGTSVTPSLNSFEAAERE